MILGRPSFNVETPSDHFACMLERIERAGRTCYKSESKIGADTAQSFAATILARGHESVIEHESITVRIICDRGVSHELVRHRLCAFSQESTRYCDYTRGHLCFVIPPWVNIEPGEYPSERVHVPWKHADILWVSAMRDSEIAYESLRKNEWAPQHARAVLPNSLKTEIVMTANLREWRHIFHLRCSKAAHPQMREIMVPLAQHLQTKLPIVFDGCVPEETHAKS